jgi:DHA1 family bicyclomycin/chloramphenicol resistance-like MFS transporter
MKQLGEMFRLLDMAQIVKPPRKGTSAILGSLTALAPLSIDMYLPALPALAADLRASASVAQLSLTFCLLGLALGQLVAGPVSDARGRRIPLLAGLFVYVAASLACAFTASIWSLILLRLVQGLAGAAGIVIAQAMVRDYFSGLAMTRFIARLSLVNGAAPILAPVIGAQLLRFTNWHGVFIVLSLLGCAMWLAAFFQLRESLPVSRRSAGGLRITMGTFRGLLADRGFMGYTLCQGFVYAAMFGYISGSPFVIQRLYGASPQQFSLMFAANGLGIIAFSQIGARLAARFGEENVLRAGLGLAGFSGLVLLAELLARGPLPGVLAPLFFAVASVGAVSTVSTSLAMHSQGRAAGSAAGLIGVTRMLLGAAAAPLVGLGGVHSGAPMGLVIAVCELAAIGWYVLLARRRKWVSVRD